MVLLLVWMRSSLIGLNHSVLNTGKLCTPLLYVSIRSIAIQSQQFCFLLCSFNIILLQFMGAPYLILCSEDDDLAPYQIICNFAQRLQELGGDVKLVKWNSSPHVGLLLNLNCPGFFATVHMINMANTTFMEL